MDATLMTAFVLIGAGAVASGAVGLALPPGERLTAGLALVVGAGAGVVILAVGLQLAGDEPADGELAFAIASAVGFVAVVVSLVVLWRRSNGSER